MLFASGTEHSGLPICNYYCNDQPPSESLPIRTRNWDNLHWAGSLLSYVCESGKLEADYNLVIWRLKLYVYFETDKAHKVF